MELVYTDVNNAVYAAGFATAQDAYERAHHRLFDRLDWLSARLAGQRYLVGDTVTEADVRLFTTLARFDAVYHGHFKCNRHKLTELPVLWAYARDLFQTPGFGDTTDFVQIKRHYYVVHTSVNQRVQEPGGRPFGDGPSLRPPRRAVRPAPPPTSCTRNVLRGGCRRAPARAQSTATPHLRRAGGGRRPRPPDDEHDPDGTTAYDVPSDRCVVRIRGVPAADQHGLAHRLDGRPARRAVDRQQDPFRAAAAHAHPPQRGQGQSPAVGRPPGVNRPPRALRRRQLGRHERPVGLVPGGRERRMGIVDRIGPDRLHELPHPPRQPARQLDPRRGPGGRDAARANGSHPHVDITHRSAPRSSPVLVRP